MDSQNCKALTPTEAAKEKQKETNKIKCKPLQLEDVFEERDHIPGQELQTLGICIIKVDHALVISEAGDTYSMYC